MYHFVSGIDEAQPINIGLLSAPFFRNMPDSNTNARQVTFDYLDSIFISHVIINR